MTEQTGNNKPNEAEGLAFPLSGNKKLIDSVRDWPTITRMSHSTQLEKLVELRDALEAAGKALTPTDDERGDLIGAASAAFNARGGAPEWEDDEIARDLIIRWHLRGFEDGEKFGRRPEVPELPTPEAWRDSIVDERCQQPSKGYTSDHDREHGLDHLLEWAQEYARIGEPLKSAALIEAARDLHRAGEVPEPSVEDRAHEFANMAAIMGIPEPQGEPSSIPFYDEKMRELAGVRAQGERKVDEALMDRIIAAVDEAGVSRAAVEGEWPECHKPRCQGHHGSPDVAMSYMKHQIIEAVKLELRYEATTRPDVSRTGDTPEQTAAFTLGVLLHQYRPDVTGTYAKTAQLIVDAYPGIVPALAGVVGQEGESRG